MIKITHITQRGAVTVQVYSFSAILSCEVLPSYRGPSAWSAEAPASARTACSGALALCASMRKPRNCKPGRRNEFEGEETIQIPVDVIEMLQLSIVIERLF